jgi:hypothetical protein
MLKPCAHEDAPEGWLMSEDKRIGSVVWPDAFLALPVMEASCTTELLTAAV